MTASGVSSMMKSTPVAVSSVRMFLPSRPMMRPFISSLGRLTTLTVASDTWSAAVLWMTLAIISLAIRSASALVSRSMLRTIIAAS